MNCGYTNNCGGYYTNNDCDCTSSCNESLSVSENSNNKSGCGDNCGILLFIIAVILIFWK